MTRLLQTALRLRRRPLRFIGMLLVAAIALAVVATIPLQAVPAGKAKTTSGGPPSVVPLPAVVSLPATVKTFIDSHCIDCHDGESAKGDLDLTVLKLDATDASSLQR